MIQPGNIGMDQAEIASVSRLSNKPAGFLGMVVDQSSRTAHGKRRRQHRIRMEFKAGLDLRGKLVAKIDEPAAKKL